MITLTQEINITENLYKAFLEAKARAEQWVEEVNEEMVINIFVYCY